MAGESEEQKSSSPIQEEVRTSWTRKILRGLKTIFVWIAGHIVKVLGFVIVVGIATPIAQRLFIPVHEPVIGVIQDEIVTQVIPAAAADPTLPADTPAAAITFTHTPKPTVTANASATSADALAPTDAPSATRTDAAMPQPTNTPTKAPKGTPTLTATATRTDTHTPVPSDSPSDPPTVTFTDSATLTATAAPTDTHTPLPTGTPTETPTAKATLTATATPTDTDTPLPTDTPTATFTATFTPTHTPTATPTDSPAPTNTRTATATTNPCQVAPAPQLTSGHTAIQLGAEFINLRSEPGMSASVISRIRRGERLQVVSSWRCVAGLHWFRGCQRARRGRLGGRSGQCRQSLLAGPGD